MITYQISIDSVVYSFEIGATVLFDGTENFDNADVILKNTTRSIVFEEGDEAKITIGSTLYRFIIQSDRMEKVTSTKYNHYVKFVEETAKLTKLYSVDRYFTFKTSGSLFTHYEILSRIYDTVPFGKTNQFSIVAGTATALGLTSPQKKFEGLNLFQISVDVMRGIKAVPRLINDSLYYTYYNELNNPITLSNLLASQKTSDFNNYATTIVSKAKNVVYDGDLQVGGTWFPNADDGITPRSSEGKYSDTKAEYQFDRPLKGHLLFTLVNLEVLVGGGPTTTFIEVDITDYVVSKERWDGLILGSTTQATLFGQIAQKNTLYYSINDTKVVNMGTQYDTLSPVETVTTMQMLIKSILDNHATYTTADYVAQEIKDLEIRAFFYPFADADVTAEKWDTSVDKRSEILSNQKDTIVDMELYGGLLNDIANRMDNNTWIVKLRHTSDSDLLELNDYTSDGYKIIKAKHELYPHHIDSTYELAKNWVTINGYQSVYRSTDPYIIGRDNVKSNFRYTEYLEFSTTERTDTGNLTTQGFETLLNLLDYDSADDLPIYHAQFDNNDTVGSNQGTDAISMSAICTGSNAIRMTCAFTSPKLAGNQQEYESGSQTFNNAIYYTDTNGYLENASVHFVNSISVTADDYPITAYQTDILYSLTNQDYFLNPNDIWGLTVELMPCTDEPDVIVVGKAWNKYNNFTRLLSIAKTIKCYVSAATTKYTIYDSVIKESTANSTAFTVDFTSHYIDVSTITDTDTKTWAIGYDDGTTIHMLFAVNYDGTSRRRIYINNLKERSTTEAL